MANSTAETGSIAAQAGASTGGQAANVETGAAAAKAEAVGAADVASPEAPKPGAETPKTDEKKPKTDAKTKESTKKVADAAKKLVDTALDEVTKSETVGETKRIKMERSHPDYAYHAGEEGELPVEKADFLIAGGFAKAVGTPEAETEPAK